MSDTGDVAYKDCNQAVGCRNKDNDLNNNWRQLVCKQTYSAITEIV